MEASRLIMPAFDEHEPPDPSLLQDCVHCGFCLPSCPTYALFGEEMDSPRGRIELMRAGVEGTPLGESTVRHLDLCLGCMACVTACPSGVRYGELLGQARQQIERRWRRPVSERVLRSAVFALFPHPRRLRPLVAALRVYQRSPLPRLVASRFVSRLLPPLARQLDDMAPPVGPPVTTPERVAPAGERRRVVGLVRGCVQSAFFGQVTAASARLLAGAGCEVVAPLDQSCCGALSLHSGREEEARRFARKTIDQFAHLGVEHVVVDAAGCGSSLKEYGKLLASDARYAARAAAFAASVRDLSEELAELAATAPPASVPPAGDAPASAPAASAPPAGVPPASAPPASDGGSQDAPGERRPLRVAYHDACHLAHAQGVTSQPRRLIEALARVQLVELDDPYCCGSAGIYNLLQVGPARELGDRKAAAVRRTGADLVVTANPGCVMQIRAALRRGGSTLPVLHLAELLDSARSGDLPLRAN
jgi:glycolate oxidase iron-sulfur subunit